MKSRKKKILLFYLNKKFFMYLLDNVVINEIEYYISFGVYITVLVSYQPMQKLMVFSSMI